MSVSIQKGAGTTGHATCDGLVVCHLPFGPTTFFGLHNAVRLLTTSTSLEHALTGLADLVTLYSVLNNRSSQGDAMYLGCVVCHLPFGPTAFFGLHNAVRVSGLSRHWYPMTFTVPCRSAVCQDLASLWHSLATWAKQDRVLHEQSS